MHSETRRLGVGVQIRLSCMYRVGSESEHKSRTHVRPHTERGVRRSCPLPHHTDTPAGAERRKFTLGTGVASHSPRTSNQGDRDGEGGFEDTMLDGTPSRRLCRGYGRASNTTLSTSALQAVRTKYLSATLRLGLLQIRDGTISSQRGCRLPTCDEPVRQTREVRLASRS